MRRYWFESPTAHDGPIKIDGDVFHHIFDVCRQGVGSKFELLIPSGEALLVEVTTVEKKHAFVRILEKRVVPPLPKPAIRLVLSVPRFPVMDSVVERAVELGVASIHPVFSDFSFVRSASSLPAGKVERWKKIVLSATQQCGRGELMTIHPAVPLKDFLQDKFNRADRPVGLFAYEGSAARHLREELQNLRQSHSTTPDEIWIFVGSEGGYSDQEVGYFTELGLSSVTMGHQVLRVETACLALVSVLKYEFDLMC